ncbi:MAG: prepilin-type N-terminal cleavage/methylation domain-containing protein, partial [Microthrixaceae bacterium]
MTPTVGTRCTRHLIDQRRRRSRSAQAGYTLMELLLVIGIAGIIFVPLMAWAGLAIRQQPVVQDGMLRTASAGLLGSYLPKDVSVAGKAANAQVGFTQQWSQHDCVGGDGASGAMQLVLVTGGETVTKVVYSQAASSEDPGQRSIWRRECNPATGVLTSSIEVYRDVVPAQTSVTCASESGDTPCRQVTMTVTPRTTDQAVTINATRRVDEAAVPTDIYGNPTPSADIEIVSRAGT